MLTRKVAHIFKQQAKIGLSPHVNEREEQGKNGLILSCSTSMLLFFFVKLEIDYIDRCMCAYLCLHTRRIIHDQCRKHKDYRTIQRK